MVAVPKGVRSRTPSTKNINISDPTFCSTVAYALLRDMKSMLCQKCDIKTNLKVASRKKLLALLEIKNPHLKS